jgi:hypothetical protein
MALQREKTEVGNYAVWVGNNFLPKTERREICEYALGSAKGVPHFKTIQYYYIPC